MELIDLLKNMHRLVGAEVPAPMLRDYQIWSDAFGRKVWTFVDFTDALAMLEYDDEWTVDLESAQRVFNEAMTGGLA